MTRISDRDRGYNRFVRRVQAMKDSSVSVGIQARDGARTYPKSRVSIAQVAAWHEKGTKNMPRRPFLSSWFDRTKRRNVKSVRIQLERSLSKGLTRVRLARLGQEWVKEVRRNLQAMTPLSLGTIRRKGSRRILVETGRLRRAIKARVRLNND